MGLFSAIFGGKKKTTSSKASGTTDIDPYAPTIPYLNDYLAQTAALYNGGAPQFSETELKGYQMLENEIANNPGAINAAITENNKTLSGAYLDVANNPYLTAIANRMGGQAQAGTNATFGGRGRTGSGLHQQALTKGIGDAVAGVYAPAYEAERGRMSSAVGMAPSLEAGRFIAPQAMISAGQNISARPFDINQQYGGILSQIAGLGQQGVTTGEQQNYKQSSGLIGKIANSFVNKLFG